MVKKNKFIEFIRPYVIADYKFNMQNTLKFIGIIGLLNLSSAYLHIPLVIFAFCFIGIVLVLYIFEFIIKRYDKKRLSK